ncbi:hypothetical protein, partial [Pseudomonas sp. Z13]|uniref:hypothetical protein n=1 Tax=Pseudomonas sp. Z13 TaxID=2983409 RepID=UPI002E810857
FSVGAGLLAKNLRAPRSSRMPTSSLTTFASKPAPTFLIVPALDFDLAFALQQAIAVDGARRSKSKSKAEHSGLPAGLSVKSRGKIQSENRSAFLWERACSRKT